MAQLSGKLEAALRAVASDILTAYIDMDARRDIAEVLLGEMAVAHAWRTRAPITLVELRRRLTLPRADGSSFAARFLAFQELDAHLRALEAQRWVVATTTPEGDEAWTAPAAVVLRYFRACAAREIHAYEAQTCRDEGKCVVFTCAKCHAGVTLLEALGARTRETLTDADGPCPRCGEPGSLRDVVIPAATHTRIQRLVRPLMFSIGTARAALEAHTAAVQRAAAPPRVEAPPTLVHARFRRERRGSERYVPSFDVYIGPHTRRHKHGTLERTEWALPGASLGARDPTVREVDAYANYVRGSVELMRALPQLAGKRLGCTCTLKRCHGQVLVDLFKLQCV